MDYQKKYFKYKSKYLSIKGGNKFVISEEEYIAKDEQSKKEFWKDGEDYKIIQINYLEMPENLHSYYTNIIEQHTRYDETSSYYLTSYLNYKKEQETQAKLEYQTKLNKEKITRI